MPLLERLNQARRRRRGHASFDSTFRKVLRGVERWLKFLISRPLGTLIRPKHTSMPLPLSGISNILIFRYDAIGDAILTTPLFRVLKRYAPDITIGVAASDRNRLLFEDDPDIDHVYLFSMTPSLRLLRECFRARRVKWDVVLNLVFIDKTRAAIYAKIAAPNAVSITSVRDRQEKYLQLYSSLVQMPPLSPPTPEAKQVLDLLRMSIALPPEAGAERPSLPDFDSTTHVRARIESELKRSQKLRYIIINTDASQQVREWGFANSVSLAEMIVLQMRDMHVFLTCAPARGKQFHELNHAASPGITYLETPSILHISTAIRGAVAVVSPDTSVVHFATAQRVPVVGFYIEPNEFLPYGGPSRVLFPPDGKTMPSIPVAQVFHSLQELLREVGVKPEQKAPAGGII